MTEWIDVNDRLPEPVDDGMYSDWVLFFNPAASLDPVWIGRYNDPIGRFVYDDDQCTPAHGVTHWMPLPKPPKEEASPCGKS